jgi:transposase
LLGLMLLRWMGEGMSRLASCKRLKVDACWRAAVGLGWHAGTPGEKTMREFERFLGERHACGLPRYLLVHEHIVRLCLGVGVGNSATWAADSTPMWCYGAVLDTVRLLGDGLRATASWYGRASGRSMAELAVEWKLPLLQAKSTKGHCQFDWRDPEARGRAIGELAQGVVRVADALAHAPGLGERYAGRRALQLCRTLVRVVEQDLEVDAEGRLGVARRVAEDRIVSLTDPQARHGRKTRSVSFEGYKLHVLGDLVSGLVAAVCVASANVADNTPMHRLLARAQRAGAVIDRLLADTAYGSARDRVIARGVAGVTVIAPVPATSRASTKHRKESFAIDFDAGTATCPAGVTTRKRSAVKADGVDGLGVAYQWPAADCRACPLRAACCDKDRGGRRLVLHPYENALRTAREAWANPELRSEYRNRSRFERLNHQLTRHGARQARSFGLVAANLQVHIIAARCNLQLLAEAVAAGARLPTAAAPTRPAAGASRRPAAA